MNKKEAIKAALNAGELEDLGDWKDYETIAFADKILLIRKDTFDYVFNYDGDFYGVGDELVFSRITDDDMYWIFLYTDTNMDTYILYYKTDSGYKHIYTFPKGEMVFGEDFGDEFGKNNKNKYLVEWYAKNKKKRGFFYPNGKFKKLK
ncbi:MAG: hypothetical protein ACOC1O_04225 [bacterium]